MSLTHFLRGAPWDDQRYSTIYDQDFGHVINFEDVIHPPMSPLQAAYLRPWRYLPGKQSGKSHVHNDKDGFHVSVDVQQFSPDEVTVKTVEDHLVIEGKHEEKKDEHGYISRHFVRRYKLPDDVQHDGITSNLSTDGVLCVTAPKRPAVEEGNVRTIPIKPLGTPAIRQDPLSPTCCIDKKI